MEYINYPIDENLFIAKRYSNGCLFVHRVKGQSCGDKQK